MIYGYSVAKMHEDSDIYDYIAKSPMAKLPVTRYYRHNLLTL